MKGILKDVQEGKFAKRRLVKKYSSEEMVSFYNNYVQDYVLKKIGIKTRKVKNFIKGFNKTMLFHG